jgi:hypothetical protein
MVAVQFLIPFGQILWRRLSANARVADFGVLAITAESA